MATTDKSTDSEVEGSIVNVIYVDNSGTDPDRTVLALATKGDVSISIEEDSEEFDPAAERNTRRYRTNNTVTVEVMQAVATDLDALDTVGIVDASSDGLVTFDPADREWASDEYLEVAYNDSELDYSTDPIASDFNQVHRFADIEVVAGEVDASSTPPMASMTFWCEGDVELDASTF